MTNFLVSQVLLLIMLFFTTVLPEYYMEAHTKMFEVAPASTPTPLAAVEAELAQGRQSRD